MVIFGKLAKLLLCYKRYVLIHPGLHLRVPCDAIAYTQPAGGGITIRANVYMHVSRRDLALTPCRLQTAQHKSTTARCQWPADARC